VRREDGTLAFDVVAAGVGSDAELDSLCDRVEALGGRLTVRSEPGGGTRITGSLPLSR
jgi:signal transduction histidine kinase